MAPCKITQYYKKASVALGFLDTKMTKFTVGILRTYCHSICAVKKVNTEFYASRKRTIMAMCRMNRLDKRMYVSLIHMSTLTTIY